MQRYFSKGNFKLEDSDIHHIKNVMRMKVNDNIEVVDNNSLYICNIDSMNPFSISVIKKEDIEDDNLYDLTVAVSLVNEQKMDLILQKLTELGVTRIIPLTTERSIVKLNEDRFQKKKKRWESICKEASEQSKRTNIPEIMNIMTFKELVKEEYDYKLVASTKEKDKLLKSYLQNIKSCAKIIIVIGPEGGLSEGEETFLVNNNFSRVSFGNLIFRVETACIYCASVFNFYSSMR